MVRWILGGGSNTCGCGNIVVLANRRLLGFTGERQLTVSRCTLGLLLLGSNFLPLLEELDK
jgi:hypothetical protein